jgi:hypothetical protein
MRMTSLIFDLDLVVRDYSKKLSDAIFQPRQSVPNADKNASDLAVPPKSGIVEVRDSLVFHSQKLEQNLQLF